MDKSARNSPHEFDWITKPRAARMRHKFVGPGAIEPTSVPPVQPPKRRSTARKAKKRLKVNDDSDSDSRTPGDMPPPLSPNFLVGSKRRYVEAWLLSQQADNSTNQERPFEGWEFTEPENKENDTKKD